MNACLLHLQFAALTSSSNATWLTLAMSHDIISLAAYMHTLSCYCKWVLAIGHVEVHVFLYNLPYKAVHV
jgi:hypothetical protein